jgi:hypothetical protein
MSLHLYPDANDLNHAARRSESPGAMLADKTEIGTTEGLVSYPIRVFQWEGQPRLALRWRQQLPSRHEPSCRCLGPLVWTITNHDGPDIRPISPVTYRLRCSRLGSPVAAYRSVR